MVFCGLFPIDTDRYEDLRDALDKLALNDAALSYEPETSEALGFGFRCGFLGLLHMEIVRERLEREYGLELLATTPERALRGPPDRRRDGRGPQPDRAARPGLDSRRSKSPTSGPRSSPPPSRSGAVMELCQERRGTHVDMHYLSPQRVQIRYDLPLGRDRPRLLRPAEVLHPRLRLARLRADRQPPRRPGQGRHPARRRQGRRALDRSSTATSPTSRARPGRAPAQDDPAPALRHPRAGGDRLHASWRARPSRRCARTSPRSSTAATSPASRSC